MVVSKWFGIGECWWLMVDVMAWFTYFFMIFHNIPWLVWCQLVYVWSRRQLGQQIWINKNISTIVPPLFRTTTAMLHFGFQCPGRLRSFECARGRRLWIWPRFCKVSEQKWYWYPLIIWNGWLEVDDLIVGPFWWSCLHISAINNLRNMWRVGPFSLAWGTWDPGMGAWCWPRWGKSMSLAQSIMHTIVRQ